MDDMHNQQETPTSDAARGVGHYLTGALATADLSVRLLTGLRQRMHSKEHLRPADLEHAGRVLDPAGQARRAMLGRDQGRSADSRTALLAWVSTQPHRDTDPEARLVAGRAEARLHTLHPDAMARYDQLRAGLSPVEAMREVVPLIVDEQQQDTARELYTPMLDSELAAGADSQQALAAWSAALPLADTVPDAATAAAAAETRLRELHPDVLARYDTLRDSRGPVEALAEVGPLIDPALHSATTRPSPAVSTAGSDARTDAAGRGPADRYVPVVREVLQAEVAEQVLHDQAWPALAGALDKAEQLGAEPAALLAAAAGERELASAKSAADVLTYRVEQHQLPTQPEPQRTPNAADLAGASYPTALAAAHRTGPSPATEQIGMLVAALETEQQAAHAAAGTPDDISTPNVDEHRDGLADADVHQGHATADQSTLAALRNQPPPGPSAGHTTAEATSAGGAAAAATAGHSYPTALHAVPSARAVPTATPVAPAARAAGRKAAAPAARRR